MGGDLDLPRVDFNYQESNANLSVWQPNKKRENLRHLVIPLTSFKEVRLVDAMLVTSDKEMNQHATSGACTVV